MAMIRVALVDDHRVVTRSLKAYLESFPDLSVVGAAVSGEEMLARLDEWSPDVILQDLLIPGGIDGIETTRRVLATGRPVKVVALTASMDEARMMGVLRAGAAGYVRKDAEPEILLAAVRAVAAGRTFIDPGVGQALVSARLKHGAPDDRDELTPRELDVLRHLALGRSNREIAARARHRRRNRQDARGACAVEAAGGKPGPGHRAGAQARADDARGAGGRLASSRTIRMRGCQPHHRDRGSDATCSARRRITGMAYTMSGSHTMPSHSSSPAQSVTAVTESTP